MRYRALCNGNHVLGDQVPHEPIAEEELCHTLENITNSHRGRRWINELIAACGREKETEEVAKSQIVRVLQCRGHGPLVDVEERCQILNSFICLFAMFFHPFQQQPIIVAHVMETSQLQKLAH